MSANQKILIKNSFRIPIKRQTTFLCILLNEMFANDIAIGYADS